MARYRTFRRLLKRLGARPGYGKQQKRARRDLESEIAAYNAGFPRWQLYRLRRFAGRFAKRS